MKLIHGNSFNELRKFGSNSFDLIITDPPYDFSRDVVQMLHKEFLRLAKCIIVFTKPENPWIYPADQHLFWIKSISTKNTSKSYSRFVEKIFVYGRNVWNPDRHWSQYTNVFYDLVDGKLHPHQKPESLIQRLMLNHSNPSQHILDPFMGSGTTGAVCKKAKRDFIGIELDEHYFEVAKNRLDQQEEQ